MILHPKKVRALGLSSGGLDSILSALVLRKHKIEVEWITFETPFFSSEKAQKASRAVKIPLTVRKITKIYLKMLKNPRCGYGRYMNPCLDCHALMFGLAGKIMEEKGFDFLFSGEVVGQRPMSQTKPSLRYVEKYSGFDGYIVRPLSAKRLPETIPEKRGLVNRMELLGISGRSRKEQIRLAEEFNITDYPAPGGGCLLTDKGYCTRLKDLFKHQDVYAERELYFLKYGRHFRIDEDTKIIVGRTKEDNENLLKHYDPAKDTLIKLEKFPGPIVLMPDKRNNKVENADIRLAASICTGYSKAPINESASIKVITPDGRECIGMTGILPEKIRRFLI